MCIFLILHLHFQVQPTVQVLQPAVSPKQVRNLTTFFYFLTAQWHKILWVFVFCKDCGVEYWMSPRQHHYLTHHRFSQLFIFSVIPFASCLNIIMLSLCSLYTPYFSLSLPYTLSHTFISFLLYLIFFSL